MSGVAYEDHVDLERSLARTVRKRSMRLLGSLLRPMRWRFALMLALVAAAQAAKAAGPLFVAFVIDTGLPQLTAGDPAGVLGAGLGYITVAFAGGLLMFWSIRLSARIAQAVLFELRRRVFRHTQRLSLEFHETYTSGRIIARQTSDLDAVRELLDSGVNQLLSGLLFMVFVAVMLLFLDPWSGLVLVAASVPVALLTRWFHVRSQLHYRSTRVASSRLIVQFVETMAGNRAVQAFHRERHDIARHRELADDYRLTDQRAVGLIGVYNPGLVLIGNVTVAAVLAVDGYRVFAGELSVGVLIAALLYAKRFFAPVQEMAQFYNSLQSSVAALEKISGLLEEEPSVAAPARPVALPRASGRIDFDGVRFGYTPGADVIPGLDLRIPAGQIVALVGTTGAGKSTVAKLVARFYDTTEGQVRLDGIDVRDLAFSDLRRAVVMVTQESFLFSGTIAENIAIGRPSASPDDIRAAARAVGADRFIDRLPDGIDTDVHKRGGRLSAGQRQLVSFARAFLADPAVIILDEATASLDLPSEAIVQRGLATLLEGRTALVIAHRLSTVESADRVIVLQGGRVAEDDSPAALLAAGGEYAALHAAWRASTDQQANAASDT
ncbi:ABC transporter ATP-binding protein [Microbacterium allomyrinae]|uniref:ABC transporter ATP-binding protein n=1 Tax=Microbacterium allomyrinae TaxID=2830666 RepID=A0A9X1LX85_9MICO|nr:ABC transporter ATP-binding protein [Microbacterium allomyrinae]MCC2033714.1 ABC transporter ATP-binding protein [Microbacterium allomyrinae]